MKKDKRSATKADQSESKDEFVSTAFYTEKKM